MKLVCLRLLSRRLLNDQYPLLKPTAAFPHETTHDTGIAAGAAKVTLKQKICPLLEVFLVVAPHLCDWQWDRYTILRDGDLSSALETWEALLHCA